MARTSRPPAKSPRRRRDAESARTAILDATEQRLVKAGPGGIRLQDIAQDVGVSHPTVLHHFGSREELVKAVIQRAVGGIHERLVEVSRAATADEGQITSMLDGVFKVLDEGGYARVILWLALEGQHVEPTPVPLSSVVDALHAMRESADGQGNGLKREDTAHAVVLATLALLGATVMGPTLLERTGQAHDAAAQQRFRHWLGHLLVSQLQGAK